ncbi:hypothetical protein AB1Y20_021092 [Prymnesium parvum]|uniref:Transglutaminase-like domain-containing protein n=1 Tax=Prymnesium parvum TaxID=97485 RepID=A0AB34JKC6_PRYPA
MMAALLLPRLACPPATVPFTNGTAPGWCEPLDAATAAATRYLRANLFPFDAANAASLFSGGPVVPTVRLALAARQRFGWAAAVPESLWREAVLPYAVVNEPRNDWRELLWAQLFPLLSKMSNASSLSDVFTLVNAQLWALLGKFSGNPSVVFRSEQTPLIYDPMSTVLFGYASCTGISLLLVDALRTAGVPARLVGTPAWNGVESRGNHNWVEVWIGGETDSGDGWAFIEGAPAGGGETLLNPCDKWFCNPPHFNHSGTAVFATRFDRNLSTASGGQDYYPMAWDLSNHDVMGEDRTVLYEAACNKC